jgi:type IV secretory pathway VirB10-like protein
MANTPQGLNGPDDVKTALKRGKIPRNVIVSVGAVAAIVIGALGFKYELAADKKAQADAAQKKAAQVAPVTAPDVGDDLDKAIKDQQAKARGDAERVQRDKPHDTAASTRPALTADDFQRSVSSSGVDGGDALAKKNNQDTIFASGFFPARSKTSLSSQRAAVPGLEGITDPAQMLALQQQAAEKQAETLKGLGASQAPSASTNVSKREAFLTDTGNESANRRTGITDQLPACTVPLGFKVFAHADYGLNSDLPGDGTATVSQNVYGGRYGDCLAIPQGASIYFKYNSDISVGQERIQVAGVRLTMPNHKVVPLLGMQFGDPDGYTGLSGDVNNHFLKIFGASLFIAVLEHRFDDSTTAQTASPNGITSYGTTSGQVAAQTAQTVMQRNLTIAPTITTKPGQEVILRLDRDLVMEPYVE